MDGTPRGNPRTACDLSGMFLMPSDGVFQLRPLPNEEWGNPSVFSPTSLLANPCQWGLHWHRWGGECADPSHPRLAGVPLELLACDKQPSPAQPSPGGEAESLGRLPQKLAGCCLTRYPRPAARLQLLASPAGHPPFPNGKCRGSPSFLPSLLLFGAPQNSRRP